MGGMARRATLINKIRDQDSPVIVVDGGGFSPAYDKLGIIKFETMLAAFLQMGYDGLSVAEPEMLMQTGGHDAWEKLGLARIPLTTLNVKYRGHGAADKPLIINREGIKVAVFSLLLQKQIPGAEAEEWHVQDPEEVAENAIAFARKNADFVIAMLWGKNPEVKAFVERHGGMDIVIDTSNPVPLFSPARINESLLVSAGDGGEYLGIVDASLSGARWTFNARLIGIAMNVPEDSLLKETYADHRERVMAMARTREREVEREGQAAFPSKPSAKVCRRCHEEIYEKWNRTPHAGAILSLLKRNEHRNPECLLCHTLGYMEGGFTSMTKTRDYAGVQCASCHGEMKGHIEYHEGLPAKEEGKSPEVKISVCRQCHTQHTDENFVFERDKKRVHH